MCGKENVGVGAKSTMKKWTEEQASRVWCIKVV